MARDWVKVDGGRYKCQGCRPSRGTDDSGSARGGPENVTSGANRAASAGPIPRTSCSRSRVPNGPRTARSSTMRCASAGPMPGRRSNSATSARSTSTGSESARGRSFVFGDRGAGNASRPAAAVRGRGSADTARGRRGRPPAATAESTAAIWAARAAPGAVLPCPPLTARSPRTARPRAATAATKSRARRSEGVGTAVRLLRAADRRRIRITHGRSAHCVRSETAMHHDGTPGAATRSRPPGAYNPRSTATATSPTTCRVSCETLSSVSSGVW